MKLEAGDMLLIQQVIDMSIVGAYVCIGFVSRRQVDGTYTSVINAICYQNHAEVYDSVWYSSIDLEVFHHALIKHFEDREAYKYAFKSPEADTYLIQLKLNGETIHINCVEDLEIDC